MSLITCKKSKGGGNSLTYLLSMIVMFCMISNVSAEEEVVDLEGQSISSADFGVYRNKIITNGELTLTASPAAATAGKYTIGSDAVVKYAGGPGFNGDWDFNIIDGGVFEQTKESEGRFLIPFYYGKASFILNNGTFKSVDDSRSNNAETLSFGVIWINNGGAKDKDISANVKIQNNSKIELTRGQLRIGGARASGSNKPKTLKVDFAVEDSSIYVAKEIKFGVSNGGWLQNAGESYVKATFGKNSDITCKQFYADGNNPSPSVTFDGATFHWLEGGNSFIGHNKVGDIYTIAEGGLTIDIPSGKSLTCDLNASSLKGEGGITKIGEGSITWNQVSSKGSQGMTFTGPMVVSNGMWTSTLGYVSKAFRADGGTLVLSGSLSAENIVLAATKGGSLKLEGADVADNSPDIELAGGGTTDYFTRDGVVGTYELDSLTLRSNAVLDIDGNAEAIDAITATALNIEATSDNPATININFSEVPKTGQVISLFAVDDIAKLNIQPKLGSLVVPHSVSIKDGVAVFTITADDFVWNGTKPNWNDEGAWTKGAEGAKWTDGNNAVFSTPNTTAILDGSASVAELRFSANAVISAKEGEESPSLLTASNIIVDEGVTGSISAELAQDIEKTGSGTLELSRSREGKTTKVSDGTIKFTDSVDVGDLVLGTDVNKSVALDYSGNKLTGKINSYMNIATPAGGNAALKNGEYQYTETLRVWNGFLTIADDTTVTMDSSASRWVCVGGNNADSESATDVDARLIIDGGSLTNNTAGHLGVGDFGSVPSKATMIVKNGGTYVGKSNAYIAQGAEGHLIVDGEGSSVTVSTLYFNGEARDEEGEDGYVSVTNGGLVAVKGITRSKGYANGYFNFDGGTLKATASGTLIAAHEKLFVNVNAEGGTIDNGGFDVTITEDLIGAGELTLAGEGTTTIAGKLEVGALKVSSGATLAFSSLNDETAAGKASEFIFEDGSSIVLPKSLEMGSYKLFELSSGEFSSDVLAKCSIEGIAIPYELKIEGNLIKILIDKNYLLFKNKNKISQEITGEVSFYGEGALDAETLTFGENAKLILDPIKTPVYIWGAEDGKGLIFADGAKIALSPDYADMSCGQITLMTFKSEYAKNLPQNLNEVFDPSSIATGAEWSITLEDVPDASVYRKNLVLTVGDYENAPEIKILPIGDSITQGVTKDSQGDYPQYRTAIAARLAANGYRPKMVGVWKYAPKNAANVVMSEDWVWHCGISGDGIKTSPNTASSQRGGVRDNLHIYLDIAGYADVITLLIGTNDIGAGDAADEVYASFRALIENISAERPNAKIIGATLLDRNEATSENHQKIIAFNDLLKSDWAAKKLPSNFVLLDLYSKVPLTSDNFFTDKLHLNWAGCSLTSEAFAEKIMEALPLSGENAFGGTQDDTVTDEAQVALGADVLVPETYRGGMERAFVIDAVTPANVFTKASPYTSVGALVSLTRKVKRAGYYMELVRAGTSRRRFVWVDFDAEGKTLDDIDFPWSGENMQFIAENMHVYSNDSSIKNVSPDKVGVKGIIEGTYHNYTAPDALEGAPKDIFGSSDTYGWNDTMGSGNAGYGCFQAHRIFSQEEGDAHWNDAQVLFAWNRWGSSTATDEIGIGDYACHANGVGNTMDYTWTSEKGTDGLPDTVTASAYQVRRLEVWASFEEETRPGVWTGAAGNNLLSDENNWTGNTLPGTEDTVFIGVSDDVELVCDGEFAVKAIEISGDGKLEISGSGSIAVASSIIRMGASRPVVNVPVEFKSGDEYVAIDVTGEVDFHGGVKGTYPVNHTTFYGTYTLTAQSWTLSKAITIAEGAKLIANETTLTRNGMALNSGVASLLKIKNFIPGGGSVFGQFLGTMEVDYVNAESAGEWSIGSGLKGVLCIDDLYYYSGGSYKSFTCNPDETAQIVMGGGKLRVKRGRFLFSGCKFKSLGDWRFEIDSNNYTSNNSGVIEIGQNGIEVDTSDYYDPMAEGHTVSVIDASSKGDQILIGKGFVNAIGNGKFKFQNTGLFTGGFVASDNITVEVIKGVYPGKGDVTIKDTATFNLVDSASGTVPVAGKLTMEGGSTLRIPTLVQGEVPLSVESVEVSRASDKKVVVEVNGGELAGGYCTIISSTEEIVDAADQIELKLSENVILPNGVNASDVSLEVINDDESHILALKVVDPTSYPSGIWVGGFNSNMSDPRNWKNQKLPENGDNLDFSGVQSDVTVNSDIDGIMFGSVTMGEKVVTFSGSLTATSFSDTSKVAVASDSIVTVNGDLILDTSAGKKYIVYKVDARGVFKVAGVIKGTGTNDISPCYVTCEGAIAATGIVSDQNNWVFRLSRNGGYVGKWVIGSAGISGEKGFWIFNHTSDKTVIQADADFEISSPIGIRQSSQGLTVITSGYTDNSKSYKITATAGFTNEKTLTIQGSGTFVCDYTLQNTNGQNAYSGNVTVKDAATLAINAGKKVTSGSITINEGAALTAKGAGVVDLSGNNVALNSVTKLGFEFERFSTAPQFKFGEGKLSFPESGSTNVVLKISGIYPSSSPFTLTSGYDFRNVTNVALSEDSPKWVKDIYVDDNGNIVLLAKPRGTRIIVR